MTRFVPRTLAISHRATPGGEELPDWAAAVVGVGVDAVQLREKDLSGRALEGLARRVAARIPATRLLLNARADVAVACGAAGVHLPAAGLPVDLLRRRFPELSIGVSAHHLDEVRAARDHGADYVTFGPVFPPLSKQSPLPPVGIEGLAAAARLGVPVLALGGVEQEHLADLAAAGAAGVAGIGAFRTTADAAALVAVARRVFGPGGAVAGGCR